MTSKHPKQKPSDADLHRNPLIGGSKGTRMAHVTPDELERFEGVNTIEGDVENDTNPLGGIDKAKVRNARRGPPDHGREPGPHIAKSLHLSKNQAKGAGSGSDAPHIIVLRLELGSDRGTSGRSRCGEALPCRLAATSPAGLLMVGDAVVSLTFPGGHIHRMFKDDGRDCGRCGLDHKRGLLAEPTKFAVNARPWQRWRQR